MVQLYMPSVYLYILGPESFYLLLESIHFCGVIRRLPLMNPMLIFYLHFYLIEKGFTGNGLDVNW